MFIGFANFYQRFIQGFSRIAALLTLLLKATGSSNLVSKAFKVDDNEVVGFGAPLISPLKATRSSNLVPKAFKADDNEVVGFDAPLTSPLKATGLSNLTPKAFTANDNEVVGVDGRANETVVNSSIQSKNEKSRNLTRVPNIGAMGEPNFLNFNAKKAFNHLRLAFIKAPILRHFDLKSHIRIETDASSYAIGGALSQLNLNLDAPSNDWNKFDLGQWHPVAYFFRKMIPAET